MAIVIVLTDLLVDYASAALFLRFSRSEAAPGEVISARTGGEGALVTIPAGSRLKVFFVSADDVSTIKSANDQRLVLLGILDVDSAGNGRLTFVVPDVPSGEYATMTLCIPCAPTSSGHSLVPTGPFDAPFVVVGDSAGFPMVPALLTGLGGLLFLAAASAWMWRRNSTRQKGHKPLWSSAWRGSALRPPDVEMIERSGSLVAAWAADQRSATSTPR